MGPAILAATDRLSRHYTRRLQQILFKFNETVPKSASKVTKDVVDSQGSRYPIMKMNDKYFPVDVARTFISFLGAFYEMLLSKVIISDANLLRHYIPEGRTHYLYKDYEDPPQPHAKRRTRG
jgi:hypothetical protein